jgi:flagellin-like hook-associated protein FlgL
MTSISGGIGGQPWTQQLSRMREQLDGLQMQLGTGRKAETYGGLGDVRTFSVGLRQRISTVEGFQQTITQVDLRLRVGVQALQRLDKIASDSRPDMRAPRPQIGASGQTDQQVLMRGRLQEALDLLNMRADDRYMFGGRATDRAPVVSQDVLINGDALTGAHGLTQIIADRRIADRGADGMGRLMIDSTPGSTVTVTRDHVGTTFGMRLSSAVSTSPGLSVGGPTAEPPAASISIDVTAQPAAGEVVTLGLALPDGTASTVTLTASVDGSAANSFRIGATTDETAANLRAALGSALSRVASTTLEAASAVKAADEFFDIGGGQSPLRVDGYTTTGEPARSAALASATGMVAGTPADTVHWYQGETGGGDPRSTVLARVDESITISYGARATEEGIRDILSSLAVFSVMRFDAADPNSLARYQDMARRTVDGVTATPGEAGLSAITVDFVAAQGSLQAARDRHRETLGVAQTMLSEAEGISTEEVAMKMTTLMMRLQASYQTTAQLARLSLVDYLR